MGGLMEITMDEVKDIKYELQKLEVHAAKTDVILLQIQETQRLMVGILDNQSRQKEKNKGFDSSVHRLNQESIEHTKAIALQDKAIAENDKKIAVIMTKYASYASILVAVAGIAYELLKSAPAG